MDVEPQPPVAETVSTATVSPHVIASETAGWDCRAVRVGPGATVQYVRRWGSSRGRTVLLTGVTSLRPPRRHAFGAGVDAASHRPAPREASIAPHSAAGEPGGVEVWAAFRESSLVTRARQRHDSTLPSSLPRAPAVDRSGDAILRGEFPPCPAWGPGRFGLVLAWCLTEI